MIVLQRIQILPYFPTIWRAYLTSRGTAFSTVAKFEVRECRIMGVMSHYKQAVRNMGDVCRSRNATLSEHRSAYNGAKSVSEPFMSEAGMS